MSGRLLELRVDEGQAIHRNQLLAVLDDEALQLQLQQSDTNIANVLANLHQAELNLAKSKTEKERYEELLAKKYISQRDYDNVENTYLNAVTSLEVTKGQLVSAQKSKDLLKLQMNQTRVYSPIDGYVIKKYVSPGMNLTTGTEMLTLASLNRVKIKFNVDQKDAAKIHKGTAVEFVTDAFPDQVFNGLIEQAAPTYDASTRTLSFSVLLPNKSMKLLPGMFGSISVVVGVNENALVVPQEAVVSRGDQTGVFVVGKDQVAAYKPVTTGITAEGIVEITSGLNEGESVVIIGQNTLRDGQTVQLLGGRDGQQQRKYGNGPNGVPNSNYQTGEKPQRTESGDNKHNRKIDGAMPGKEGTGNFRRRENNGQ